MNTDSKPSALADLLRKTTKLPHHRLDHHPLLQPLARSTLSREDYQRILLTLAWIHLPLHQHLVAAMGKFILMAPFRISPRPDWLKADLSFFGLDDDLEDNPLLDRPMRPVKSVGELVGMLYVVEGSTMGGQVIARCLQQGIGITADTGGRFFSGHAEETMRCWGEFWHFAEQHCPDKPSQLDASFAAFDLFDQFEALLTCAHRHWLDRGETLRARTVEGDAHASI